MFESLLSVNDLNPCLLFGEMAERMAFKPLCTEYENSSGDRNTGDFCTKHLKECFP